METIEIFDSITLTASEMILLQEIFWKLEKKDSKELISDRDLETYKSLCEKIKNHPPF